MPSNCNSLDNTTFKRASDQDAVFVVFVEHEKLPIYEDLPISQYKDPFIIATNQYFMEGKKGFEDCSNGHLVFFLFQMSEFWNSFLEIQLLKRVHGVFLEATIDGFSEIW